MKKPLLQAMAAIAVIIFFFSTAHARIEWDVLNSINLDEKPISVAISKDGLKTYILCKKSIKIYSKLEKKITDIIPLTGSFSQIIISPDGEKLLLTDPEKNRISIIRVMPIYDIKTGQSPVIGKIGTPVHIIAFSDYQ